MIVIYPGQKLGKTERPIIAFTLGYLKSVSSLSPVAEIIGSEFRLGILSEEGDDLTSVEADLLLVGIEPEDIVSLTLVTDITSELSGDVESEIPGAVESEEPGGILGDEPDDVTSEEPT